MTPPEDYLYQHLGHYGLSKREHVLPRLIKMPTATIDAFLGTYIERARNWQGMRRAQDGVIDIYPDSWASRLPNAIIQQLALYADRIYLHDPLLDLAYRWRTLAFDWEFVLRHPSLEDRVTEFRVLLAATIENLVLLRPLVQLGVTVLLPSRLTQQIRRLDQIYADEIYGPQGSAAAVAGGPQPAAELPAPLLQYCEVHLRVLPAELARGRPVLLSDVPIAPRRMVGIQFDGEPNFMFRALPEIVKARKEDGRAIVDAYLQLDPPQPVDPATFAHWVHDEKHRYAVMRVQRLQQDIQIAATTRARFLTNLRTSHDLAVLTLPADASRTAGDSAATDPVASLLKLELPYFERITLAALAQARRDEAAFAEFRAAFSKALEEIAAEPDARARQARTDAMARELLQAPVARIRQKMDALRLKLALSGSIVAGSLTSTLFSHASPLALGASLAVASYGAVEALKSYKADMAEKEQIRQSPGFFYWQATRAHR